MSEKIGFLSFLKKSIPRTIWAIGISSLLINIATSVVFSQFALYLKTILEASNSTIGLVESLLGAIAYAVRIFSGVISDYFKKRKPLMILGFSMITLASPILALSRSFIFSCFARAVDRIGNGIQAAPREALISDSAPKESKGACFGLRQSLSVIGSALGGLFGIIVMKMSGNNFSLLFFLAGIPAAIAVAVLILFVKEKKHEITDKASSENQHRRNMKLSDAKLLGKNFWLLMIVASIFMLGRFSEIFITLHAYSNFNLSIAYGTVITMIFNISSAFISYPIGKMSDKMDRTTLLLIGFIFLLASHLILGFAVNLSMIFIGTLMWGFQIGITQSIFAALVSDYVPKDLRGTGFGVYSFISAVSTFIASALAGVLSQANGEAFVFIMGAVVCFIATILLCFSKNTLKTTRH